MTRTPPSHPLRHATDVDVRLTSAYEAGVTDWTTLAQALHTPDVRDAVVAAGAAVTQAVAAGGTVLVAGNGGSAAIASHIAAEFVGKCIQDRPALPAINLGESLSAVTAIGNDYGYADVFARAVAAYGRAGDVLIAMSTSGRSENIARALEEAAARGIVTVALVGAEPNLLADADHVLCVPSRYTPRIQEVHMLWAHSWCEAIDALSQPNAS